MRHIGILIFLVCTALHVRAKTADVSGRAPEGLLSVFAQAVPATAQSDSLLHESLAAYRKQLNSGTTAQRIHATRQLAFVNAQLMDAEAASRYIREYLLLEFRPEVLSDRYFDPVRERPAFREVVATFTPQMSFWSYLYLYIGLIGIYIVMVLALRRKVDLTARLLIGGFVLIHSVFILHIGLVITNYQFELPHSYLSSTAFSFLYGPLLYFYFKRTASGYRLRLKDSWHLLPTVLLLAYLIPIYILPESEKLELLLNRQQEGNNPSDSAYLVLIVSLKLASLVAYGWLIRREFPQVRKKARQRPAFGHWEQNIYRIHVAYILCYAIYGILIINGTTTGVLYHAQVLSMSLMVIYVGYFASIRPEVFGGSLAFHTTIFSKYKKSGLTPSLSIELKDRLAQLFDQDKIYRENDINLDRLATLLDTTRHNASQVINEHFGIGFHELLNRYRIGEAKEMLEADQGRNLHIIDIVYEVGYNNKVTFNKAFKKETGLTPSAYLEQASAPRVKQA